MSLGILQFDRHIPHILSTQGRLGARGQCFGFRMQGGGFGVVCAPAWPKLYVTIIPKSLNS